MADMLSSIREAGSLKRCSEARGTSKARVIPKHSQKCALTFACVGLNDAHWRKPPKFRLPQVEQVTRLMADAGHKAFLGKTDLSNCFWSIRMPVPVYARKNTKSPGGREGLSAHVKMKNRLHREKEATCSPHYSYGCDCCCTCYQRPPSELQYSVQGFKPAVSRRAVKSSTHASKGRIRHFTCRPSCQPLYERMRGSSQTPCKPREKIKTNKAIRLTFPRCLPALNTVSDITVRVKGSQPTRRVCRIQIRAHP